MCSFGKGIMKKWIGALFIGLVGCAIGVYLQHRVMERTLRIHSEVYSAKFGEMLWENIDLRMENSRLKNQAERDTSVRLVGRP